MSFKIATSRRAIAPAISTLVVAAVALYPRSALHAEGAGSTDNHLQAKKPIYDDFESETTSTPVTRPVSAAPTSSSPARRTNGPSPTDRLAMQVGKTRLFLYERALAAENGINNTMTKALKLENSFTNTIANLAPSPQSGERLMPGSIYVLVAAMTGSIISRNRNILLRGITPLAVGWTAGLVVLPVTMKNVGDLIWTYEERFPAVAEAHLRTKSSILQAWDLTKSNTKAVVNKVDAKVGESREAVEGWVKKSK